MKGEVFKEWRESKYPARKKAGKRKFVKKPGFYVRERKKERQGTSILNNSIKQGPPDSLSQQKRIAAPPNERSGVPPVECGNNTNMASQGVCIRERRKTGKDKNKGFRCVETNGQAGQNTTTRDGGYPLSCGSRQTKESQKKMFTKNRIKRLGL